MSSSTTLSATLTSYGQLMASHIRRQPVLVATAAAAVLLPLTSFAYKSYRGFIAVGRGGLPHNVIGWAMQGLLQPLGRHDVADPEPFSNPKVFAAFEPHGRTRFLGDAPLPQRNGDRPTVPMYIAPQRQITEQGDAALVVRLNAHLADLAGSSAGELAIRSSGLEARDEPALFLITPSPISKAKLTNGEIAHVHPEGSSHCILSLADAQEAVSKGWAQRHMLSGVLSRVPLSYVLIYAPRDEEEIEVWKRILGASVAFTCAPQKASL